MRLESSNKIVHTLGLHFWGHKCALHIKGLGKIKNCNKFH